MAAEVAISGITGSVTFAEGYTTNVHKWSLNPTCEMLETTAFADGAWRTYIGGQMSGTGSYECYIDSVVALPVDVGDTGTATFQIDSTTPVGYKGPIRTTGIKAGVSKDGSDRTLTVEFEFNGEMTNVMA